MASYYSSGRRPPRPRGKRTPPPPVTEQSTKGLTNALCGFTTFDSAEYAALYAELARRSALPHWAATPTTPEEG